VVQQRKRVVAIPALGQAIGQLVRVFDQVLEHQDADDCEVEILAERRVELASRRELRFRVLEAVGGLQKDSAIGVIRGGTGIERDDAVVARDRLGDFALSH
jgi:hypothetical protein